MQTPAYSEGRSISRYYLAYRLSEELGEAEADEGYFLLLNGFWYDPENTFSNANYLKAYLDIAEQTLPTMSDEERPYYEAVTAYVYSQDQQPDKAREKLEAARASMPEDAGLLSDYISRVEGCLATPGETRCRPETLIETEEDEDG
nr:hypothetical protein GCM10011355_29570 [Aquisalinus luteolus]